MIKIGLEMITWHEIHNDIVRKISNYLSDGYRKNFALACKKNFKAINHLRILHLSPPHHCDEANGKENILIEIIASPRFSNVKKLMFGISRRVVSAEFHEEHEIFLEQLIKSICSSKIHPLNRIETLEIGETVFYSDCNGEKNKSINRRMLQALLHSNLKRLHIQAEPICSQINGPEIAAGLNKAICLTHFSIYFEQVRHELDLSFEKNTNLKNVCFQNVKNGNLNTIESLKKCSKLSTLRFENSKFSHKVANILEEGPWKLKKLEISSVCITSDESLIAITRHLPDLKVFEIKMNNISDEALRCVGLHCTSLLKFQLNYREMTNRGLDLLTKSLTQLEDLRLLKAFHITSPGILSIAANCPKLQILVLDNLPCLPKEDVDVLNKKLPFLKALGISHVGTMNCDNAAHIFTSLKKVRFIDLFSFDTEYNHLKIDALRIANNKYSWLFSKVKRMNSFLAEGKSINLNYGPPRDLKT